MGLPGQSLALFVRSVRSTTLAAVLGVTALAAGCSANSAPVDAAQPAAHRPGDVITRAEIAANSWRTAWEILQNATHLQLVDIAGGSQVTVLFRGRSSVVSNAPLLFIDGVRTANLAVLKQIPAGSIDEIRVLSGLEASIAYIGGTAAGVIEITTITN